MSTQETLVTEEAIRLFTVQSEEGEVAAVIPIRWCISRETAQMLESRRIEDPQLLIIVSHDGQEMDRHIVPLMREMHYIQFRRPGENIVHATIVWQRSLDDEDPYGEEPEKPKKVLTDRFDSGEYKARVIVSFDPLETLSQRISALHLDLHTADYREDGSEVARLKAEIDQAQAEFDARRVKEPVETRIRSDFDGVSQLGYEAQLGVVVPEQMFGKSWPITVWLGTRYNRIWPRKAVDQCDMRRRATFTLVTSPVAVPAMLVVGVVFLIALVFVEVIQITTAGAALFLGKLGMRWAYLIPLGEDAEPKHIWRDSGPSLWTNKKVLQDGKYEYKPRAAVFLVLNPPAFTAAALIGAVLGLDISGNLTDGLIGGAITWIILCVLVFVFASEPMQRWLDERAVERRRDREEAERRAREELSRELELLACDQKPREVSLKALPKERRTVVLRFYDLKAKVCRPFAR